MKLTRYPVVRPVLELGLNTLPLNSVEKKLANRIERKAAKERYISTPDGWFVPLNDLRNDIPIVAEFIWHETIHYGEFEIGGGFDILINSHQLLGIPTNSNFRFGMDLANTVIKIRQGESRNISVGAQDFWKINVDNNQEEIITIIRNESKEPPIKSPLQSLKKRFRLAQLLVVDFSNKLEFCLNQYDENMKITSSEIRFMFGIDYVGETS